MGFCTLSIFSMRKPETTPPQNEQYPSYVLSLPSRVTMMPTSRPQTSCFASIVRGTFKLLQRSNSVGAEFDSCTRLSPRSGNQPGPNRSLLMVPTRGEAGRSREVLTAPFGLFTVRPRFRAKRQDNTGMGIVGCQTERFPRGRSRACLGECRRKTTWLQLYTTFLS